MTDLELIYALGGARKVASLCEVSERTAFNWINNGLPNGAVRKYLQAEFKSLVRAKVREVRRRHTSESEE